MIHDDDSAFSTDDAVLSADDDPDLPGNDFVPVDWKFHFATQGEFTDFMNQTIARYISNFFQNLVEMRVELDLRTYNVERVGISSSTCTKWRVGLKYEFISASTVQVSSESVQTACVLGWESRSPVMVTSVLVLTASIVFIALLLRRLSIDLWVVRYILKRRKEADRYFASIRQRGEQAHVILEAGNPGRSSFNSRLSAPFPSLRMPSLRTPLVQRIRSPEPKGLLNERESADALITHTYHQILHLTHELPKRECRALIRKWDIACMFAMGLSIYYSISCLARGDAAMQNSNRLFLAFSVFLVYFTFLQVSTCWFL